MINRRTITTAILSGALAFGAAGPATAKHGADDPPSHEAGDDHGRRHGGNGADDGARHGRRHNGDDDAGGRRGRGNDDGPNHD